MTHHFMTVSLVTIPWLKNKESIKLLKKTIYKIKTDMFMIRSAVTSSLTSLEVEEESEDQLDDDSSSQHSDMAMTESDTLQELTANRTIER